MAEGFETQTLQQGSALPVAEGEKGMGGKLGRMGTVVWAGWGIFAAERFERFENQTLQPLLF